MDLDFEVTLYTSEDSEAVYAKEKMRSLVPISSIYPDFSGRIEYEASFDAPMARKCYLEFESIGENAELYVNGKYCGMRICPPYKFDITDALIEKSNKSTV